MGETNDADYEPAHYTENKDALIANRTGRTRGSWDEIGAGWAGWKLGNGLGLMLLIYHRVRARVLNVSEAKERVGWIKTPKWGPQRETRQTVRVGLNDVRVGGCSASNRLY